MRTFMKSTRRNAARTALLALSCALALAGRSFAADGVLGKVPEDAMVVIKVNNLAATSAKVAKLAQQLGLDMFVPQLSDPLGQLKTQLKIAGGLNDAGELAFVFLDPKGGPPDKSMLILIPTSDYKTLVGGIEGATTEGNLTVKAAPDGSNTYIADWNGYAAASPNKDLVAAAPTAFIQLPARAAKELAGNDLSLFANMAKIREPLAAEMAKGREKSKAEMLDQMKAKGEVPEKFFPVATAAFDQVFNVFDAFLRDADAATIGVSLTDTGIKENVVADFTPDSYLGKLTAKLKGSDAPMLQGLPTGKYLVYGGISNSPDVLNQLIDDVAGPIVKALPQDEEDLKIVPQYITDLKGMIGNIHSQTFGMVTPTGPVGQEGLFQLIGTAQGDGGKIMEAAKSFNDKYAKLTNDLVGGAQGIQMKQEWADAAKTIGGIPFASITTEIVGDSPQANQARQGMQFMYGGDKTVALLGSTGDGALTFIGVNDDLIGQTITTAKAKQSPLANLEPVMAVTKQLPSNRIAEVYVQVDEIAATALKAANQFGLFQGNVQLPPDLQPIGLTVSTDGSSVEGSAYISADLLQALISAGIQASQRANGGGGGGGL